MKLEDTTTSCEQELHDGLLREEFEALFDESELPLDEDEMYIEFKNGSRIVGIPTDEDSIDGIPY